MAKATEKASQGGTLRNLRTAVTARIRSKPTIEGQRYLDLYVLQRDRLRWLRLIQQAERSIHGIDQALRKIGFDPEWDGSASPQAPAARAVRGAVAGGTRRTTSRRTHAA